VEDSGTRNYRNFEAENVIYTLVSSTKRRNDKYRDKNHVIVNDVVCTAVEKGEVRDSWE